MLGRKTLWKSKNPHSLDYLKYLYQVLCKHQTVTESNSSLLVEALRMISEILIWGDQNDSSVTDFFLEKNMLKFFLQYMNQKSSRFICVQLLQTLNILFENISNNTSIYYLLSNNHVNLIICHKFDFSDEEVMAYYISFLKTLSFKLNKHTIHFFYNEFNNDFALYTEAIKFFNHSESMVRIAVRTITLNVFKVEDKAMLRYIRDKTAVPYFSNLVWFIGNHILEINSCVSKDKDHINRGKLEDLVAEHLDHLHYLNDILSLQIPELNDILCNHLINRLLLPLYVCSLLSPEDVVRVKLGETNGKKTGSDEDTHTAPLVRKGVAIFLLAQVYLILHHAPLSRALALVLFHGYLVNSASSQSRDESTLAAAAHMIQSISSSNNKRPARSLNVSPKHQSNHTMSTEWGFIAPDSSLSHMLEQTRGEPRPAIIIDKEGMMHRVPRTLSNEDIATIQVTQDSHFILNSDQDDSLLQQNENREEDRINNLVQQLCSHIASCSTIHISPTSQYSSHLDHISTTESCMKEVMQYPFLNSLFQALSCVNSSHDYECLFALCLLYGMYTNKGMCESALRDLFYSSVGKGKEGYNEVLVEKLIEIMFLACKPKSYIRLATLEMTIGLLKQLVIDHVTTNIVGNSSYNLSDGEKATMSKDTGSSLPPISTGICYLQDSHLAMIENAREESLLLLRSHFKSEEIFLDMFEDEYYSMHCRPLNVEYLLMDATLLLKPAETPLSGIEFSRRLPSGEAEHTKRAIRVFLQLRGLSHRLRDEEDTCLPLDRCMRNVELEDKLDLRNSDLIACTVVKDGKKDRRFLVVDYEQMILVEPDSKRLGWGVVTFVGHLQHVELSPNPDDTRSLLITVRRAPNPSPSHRSTSSSITARHKLLSGVKFLFDDHIRCNAAKQRLTRGRERVLYQKMQKIAKLLELPPEIQIHCGSSVKSQSTTSRVGVASNRSSQLYLNQQQVPEPTAQTATLNPSMQTVKSFSDQQETNSSIRRWLENVSVQSIPLETLSNSPSSIPVNNHSPNTTTFTLNPKENHSPTTDGSDSGVAEATTSTEIPVLAVKCEETNGNVQSLTSPALATGDSLVNKDTTVNSSLEQCANVADH